MRIRHRIGLTMRGGVGSHQPGGVGANPGQAIIVI